MARCTLIAAALALALGAPTARASQNHLVNSHFASSLTGWTVPSPSGYSVNWTDARGAAAPGAASVYAFGADVLASAPISQCVRVAGSTSYKIDFDFRWESGFGTAEYAYAAVAFYTGSACGGDQIVAIGLLPTSSTEAQYASLWQHVSTGTFSPANAVSMRVWVTVRTHVADDAQGYIDDVKVTQGSSGDANGDGAVDVSDVFYLLNALFGGGPAPLGPCDVNDSDWVDAGDVFYLINFLLANGAPPK